METTKRLIGVCLFLIVVSISSRAQSPLCPISFKPGGGSYVNSMTINGQIVPGYTPEGSSNSYPTYIDNSNANAGRLVKGMTYSLSINVNSGAFNYYFVKLWIDFNGNNIVNAVNEIVFLANSQFQGGHVFTGNITIPADATIGEKHLRVITTLVNPTEECGNWEPYLWGQAIDYTVTIAEPSIIPSSLSVCQGANSILTLSTKPGTAPYTFTYTINDGVNQTVSTFGNNTSVDVPVNTYAAGTYTYKLLSIKDAADNDLPLSGTTSVVTVKALPPKPTITGSSTICPGTVVQLTSSSATNNLWSTGATSQTISVTQPGNYYVAVTNADGCTNTSEIYNLGEITYFESPIVTESNYKNLCLGSSTTINVTGASGYTWSPAIGLSATTGASVIANPTATTVYTITSASTGNCSTSVTVNVLNPPLSITANGPVIFCEDDSVQLSAKPDAGHAFALNGVSNAITTPNLVQAFPTFPSSVTIELWFKADRQGVIVTELGPNQFGNIGINNGWHDSQIEILADGRVKIRVWDLPSLELGIASFSAWQHVALRYNATTQTLDGFLNNVKSASSVQGVRLVPSGQFWAFGATDNQNLGSGEYFSGQMDEIRIWNVARTDAQILNNFKIPVPGNSYGLVAYYKFDEVSDYTAIDATLHGYNASIWNTSITDATPSRQVSTAPLDYVNYLWSTGAITPDIRVKTTGNYSVTIQGSESCLSTASQQVTVRTKLVPVDSVVTICRGDSATLSVTGPGGYSWFPATGLNATAGSSVMASPSVSTTYTITSTDPDICPTTIRVNVNPLPDPLTITASGPTTFCSGGSVTLTANGATNYVWSTGATTSSINVTQGGIYTVTSTNENGCSASANKQVDVVARPQVTGSNNITLCAGESATLTVSGGDSYSWSPANYLNQTTGPSVIVTPYATTVYKITSSNDLYCPATITVNVNQRPETPIIMVNGPMAFCEGGSTQLSTQEYTSYLWSNGDATQNINVTENGIYSVTAINEYGCTSTSESTTITVYPLPGDITISGDTTICQGSSTTLTPAGATSYVWSGIGNVGPTFTVSPVITTTYTVYGFTELGCNKTASITVHVDPATLYYKDNDGDGFGNINETMSSCKPIAGWVLNSLDCDDTDPAINPDAIEVCDGKDNNCNGQVDEVPDETFYLDADGDGYGGNNTIAASPCDVPPGYVKATGDCNDNDATIHPGATEICDGKDNNCNGSIDEGFPAITYYRDNDGDGYGNSAISITAKCGVPAGYVTNNTDCNDNNASIHPGATELCDGIDNNCDGSIDEGFPVITYYQDSDGDGYGNSAISVTARCNVPAGYVSNNTDCNDKDAAIHAPKQYYYDNDHDGFGGNVSVMLCSSTAPFGYSANTYDCDDNNNFLPQVIYVDADGDGFGAGNPIYSCAKSTTGYSTNNLDCNDNDPSVSAPHTYYVDADGDGIGSTPQVFCLSFPPPGYSTVNGDCNDNDPAILGMVVYYLDADGDGFGNGGKKLELCSPQLPPPGYVNNNLDCDDNNITYEDKDKDGYGSNIRAACGAINNTDCDDNDNTVYPGAPEICDGKDNNCNGTIDEGFTSITYYRDADGDGYGNAAITTTAKCNVPAGYVTNSTDCNDADATIHPGAPEICDGKDNNCNGTIDEGFTSTTTYYRDADGDGYGNATVTTTATCSPPAGYVTDNTDCNDNDPGVHTPIRYYPDADKDGYGVPTKSILACTSVPPMGYSIYNTDCNDKNAAIHPGAIELCDGIDNNCDGQIDEGCAVVSISVNDVSIVEGNTGKKTITFNVTLSQSSTKAVTVNYTTANGTATAPSDYAAKSGSLSFKAGITTQAVDITIAVDKTIEPNELFYILLSNPVNAIINKGTGTGTIINDDGNLSTKSTGVSNMQEETTAEPVPFVKFWPNPANSIVNLQLYGYRDNVTIQLLTLNGKVLQQQKINMLKAGYGAKLNVGSYASGTYILIILDEKGNKHIEKLIIIK